MAVATRRLMATVANDETGGCHFISQFVKCSIPFEDSWNTYLKEDCWLYVKEDCWLGYCFLYIMFPTCAIFPLWGCILCLLLFHPRVFLGFLLSLDREILKRSNFCVARKVDTSDWSQEHSSLLLGLHWCILCSGSKDLDDILWNY